MQEEVEIIIDDNKYAKLVTKNEKLFNKIKHLLSFKAAGVEYTPAFKSGWNGITYLMDKKGYFLIGLLDNVLSYLQDNKINVVLTKKHISISNNKEIDISKALKDNNFDIRDYQHRVVNAALENTRGIVRACTGSGKTLCTALITAKVNDYTIIYTIGLDLLNQFHQLFSKLFNEEIGFIGNGVCSIKRINIASIWTIGSALKIKQPVIEDEDDGPVEKTPSQEQSAAIINMLKQTKLHIFDESHVVTTDTIKKIYDKINPERIYGFSGTPFRDDGSDLLINGILGEQIINVSASELITAGHLAQPIIKYVKVPKLYVEPGSNYQTIYKEYITGNPIRNNLIVNGAKELLDKNYQVLILFKNLQHGKNLRKILDDRGINYEYLSGADSLEKRMQTKENLLSHKVNLVLASSIFDIGVDISSLSALVLAGGGKSSIRTLQRVGRVIRKYKTKKFAAIIDFYDDIRFLKQHSKKRYKVYRSEEGFKLIVPKNITDLD